MGGELGILDYAQQSLTVSWHEKKKKKKYIYIYIYIYIYVCWAQQVRIRAGNEPSYSGSARKKLGSGSAR